MSFSLAGEMGSAARSCRTQRVFRRLRRFEGAAPMGAGVCAQAEQLERLVSGKHLPRQCCCHKFSWQMSIRSASEFSPLASFSGSTGSNTAADLGASPRQRLATRSKWRLLQLLQEQLAGHWTQEEWLRIIWPRLALSCRRPLGMQLLGNQGSMSETLCRVGLGGADRSHADCQALRRLRWCSLVE